MRTLAVVALLLAIAVFLGWYLPKEPQGERVWSPELSKTASAEIEHGIVHLHNVRDWTYEDGKILTTTWLEFEVIDPALLSRAWFVFEPFPSLPAAGHTYLTFELEDGRAYSFSVEARKEAHESYSALKGLFNEYELAYTWGTERDFLSRRLVYLEHSVHMYPLTIDRDATQALFLGLIRETNELATQPRFYNTLTANCTNLLAEMSNAYAVERYRVPYDLAWNLPGLSETFLTQIGFIPEGDYDLTPYQEEIATFAETDAVMFSEKLRTLPVFKRTP